MIAASHRHIVASALAAPCGQRKSAVDEANRAEIAGPRCLYWLSASWEGSLFAILSRLRSSRVEGRRDVEACFDSALRAGSAGGKSRDSIGI